MTQKVTKAAQKICEDITKLLDEGVCVWHKPWFGTNNTAVSHVTGTHYSLLNQMTTMSCGEYLTDAQAQKEGGYVKKDAKSRFFMFYKMLKISKQTGNIIKDSEKVSPDEYYEVPYLTYFNVFEVSDCENIIRKYPVTELPELHPEKDENIENVITDYCNREKINITRKGYYGRAYYDVIDDTIEIPDIRKFTDKAEYYLTVFDELVHSYLRISKARYAYEELIAEIGAAAICHALGIDTENSIKNNAAYIASWKQYLSDNKNAIVMATRQAEKAYKRIMNIQEAMV